MAPPAELPSQELASQHNQIILFLDEMNSAAPAVQAAAYQLILNRRVGTYHLPDNVVIVAAGNRETDKGVTYRMPAPLANRFLHLELRTDYDDWLQWATNNRVHEQVVGYIGFAKQDLYDFDPKSSSRSFATPRSWNFVSDLLNDDDLAYAKIRLDDQSWSTALSHLADIADPLARALIWGAAWDATRDGEASPREFIESFKTDLELDQIFVFTPRGEVKLGEPSVDRIARLLRANGRCRCERKQNAA